MTAIVEMDRDAAKRLNQLTRDALSAEAADLGLTVELGRGTFDPSTGTYSVKVTYSLADAEAKAFAATAPLFGLDAEDYGAAITMRGRRFRIVGFNLRAPRFPIWAEGEDGKRYKMTEDAIALVIAARADR